METTANLSLPYLAAAQAQKHVSVNESLRILDTLVQASVQSRAATAPPATPVDGTSFIVPDDGEAAWTVPAGTLMARVDGAWQRHAPREGWLVHVADEGAFAVFRGGAWEPFGAFDPADLAEVPLVGVATRADGVNRLAVASPASLFTHAGGDHRMVVNRASEDDTASIVFQTDYTGGAEMGLAGENAFSFKVSDGTAWTTALAISPAGVVETPARPLVRAFLGGGWRSTANGATGFSVMTHERGGFRLGEPVGEPDERLGQRLVVPATGLYLLTLQVYCGPGANFRVMLRDEADAVLAFIQMNENAETQMTQALSTVVALEAGTGVALHYLGPARCFHGAGHTELSLVMV